MNKLLTVIVSFLLTAFSLTACATTCPKPVVTEVPVITAQKVEVPSCPVLPILEIPTDASFDVHLKAWDATLIILKGCNQSARSLLNEVNK